MSGVFRRSLTPVRSVWWMVPELRPRGIGEMLDLAGRALPRPVQHDSIAARGDRRRAGAGAQHDRAAVGPARQPPGQRHRHDLAAVRQRTRRSSSSRPRSSCCSSASSSNAFVIGGVRPAGRRRVHRPRRARGSAAQSAGAAPAAVLARASLVALVRDRSESLSAVSGLLVPLTFFAVAIPALVLERIVAGRRARPLELT